MANLPLLDVALFLIKLSNVDCNSKIYYLAFAVLALKDKLTFNYFAI
jgi:hypothetical protein